jgi:hypothetical protein
LIGAFHLTIKSVLFLTVVGESKFILEIGNDNSKSLKLTVKKLISVEILDFNLISTVIELLTNQLIVFQSTIQFDITTQELSYIL